jgi:hypothetical protein
MKATFRTREAANLVRRKEGLAVLRLDHIGCQEFELGAVERIAILAAINWVAAAFLHALQLFYTLIELMVSDRGEIHTHQIKGFNGRLVMENARQQRAGANQITTRNKDGVGIGGFLIFDIASQICRAAKGIGGFQCPMEVVNGQDLNIDRGFRPSGRDAADKNQQADYTQAYNRQTLLTFEHRFLLSDCPWRVGWDMALNCQRILLVMKISYKYRRQAIGCYSADGNGGQLIGT